MPEIKNWILSAKPNDDEGFDRRKLLATALEKWFATNKNPFVGISAAALALSIKHEATSTPPGEPMTVTFHYGVVAQDQLSKIATLWPKILPILHEALPMQGSEIANIFHEWVHPNCPEPGMSREYQHESRAHARRMLGDLLEAYAGKWPFHYDLYNYSSKLGLLDKIKIDPIAEVLYPPRDFSDWEREEQRRAAAADSLASRLMDKDPISVAQTLTPIEMEARAANMSGPSWGRHVCCRIAEAIDNPASWIQAFLKNGAPADLLEPFFEKAAGNHVSDAQIETLLASEKHDLKALGVSLVVKHSFPGTAIWQQASPLFKDYSGVIGLCVLRKQIRNENLKALLNHEEPDVSAAVAAKMWRIGDDGRIPDNLFEDWKREIIRHVDQREQHILERIFLKHPDIAVEWILRQFEGPGTNALGFYFGLRYDRALPAAIRALTREQRRALIDKLPQKSGVGELVCSLVDRDMELFLHLLSREELGDMRLDPLRINNHIGPRRQSGIEEFDDSWQKMAIAAIEIGFSEIDIVSATQRGGFGWSGPMSAMLAAKLLPFERLLSNPNDHVRKIGQIGFEHFSKLRDEHLAAEKRATVRGQLV